MDELIDRRAGTTTETNTPKPRWRRALLAAGHFVAASSLLAAGVVFTMQQQHPEFRQPAAGFKLPAAVVEAPSLAKEADGIAAVLRRYTHDDEAANRIAGAIVDEGNRQKIDPAILVGVLLTEDATLDTTARSNVGARGLMQVMPTHAGKWGCGSNNLFSIESNICHGASILADNLRSSSNMRTALLQYNGCVHGSNTPNCHTYPDKVLRAANRATAEMMAVAE